MTNTTSLKLLTCLVLAGVFLSGCSQPATTSPDTENSDLESGAVLGTGSWGTDGSLETVEQTSFVETITDQLSDEFGEYSVTKTNYPDLGQVLNLGVQPGALESSVRFFTDFVMLEVLDSPALDNHGAYPAWLEQTAPKYFDPATLERLSNALATEPSMPPIFNNRAAVGPFGETTFATNSIPRLVRDGGPRVINKKIWGIEAAAVQGGIYLNATGSAVFVSNSEQGDLLDYQRFLEGKLTSPPPCLNENGEPLENCNSDQNPDEPRLHPARFHVGLFLTPKGNSWQISSFSTYFSVSDRAFFAEQTFLTQLRESIQ